MHKVRLRHDAKLPAGHLLVGLKKGVAYELIKPRSRYRHIIDSEGNKIYLTMTQIYKHLVLMLDE